MGYQRRSTLESIVKSKFVGSQVVKLPLDLIKVPNWLPKRTHMGDIVSLVKSIKSKGDVDVPIKVRPLNDGTYELVWGSRRLVASRLAGLEAVSCIVENLSDEELIRQSLVENMLRDDRNPVEEAEIFKIWAERTGKTYEEIAKILGVNSKYIYNRVELLRLPPLVLEKIKNTPIDRKPKLLHLLYLKKLNNERQMLQLLDEIIERDMPVSELRKKIDILLTDGSFGVDSKTVEEQKPRKKLYDLTVGADLLQITLPVKSCDNTVTDATIRTFTHFDTPSLFFDNGKTVEDYPITKFIGRGVILDVRCSNYDEVIDLERVKAAMANLTIQSGEFLLLYTGWSRYYQTQDYFRHPSISLEVAHWVVEKGISILGFDMPNPTRVDSRLFHETLLKKDILLLENLGDMSEIARKRVSVIALPVVIKDAKVAPVRVIAKLRKKKRTSKF